MAYDESAELTYEPTTDGDLMQILDGRELSTLGVRLSPDTADLFAASPLMLRALRAVEAGELPAGETAALVRGAIEMATACERYLARRRAERAAERRTS